MRSGVMCITVMACETEGETGSIECDNEVTTGNSALVSHLIRTSNISILDRMVENRLILMRVKEDGMQLTSEVGHLSAVF
jgi:hypothetical protein